MNKILEKSLTRKLNSFFVYVENACRRGLNWGWGNYLSVKR